MTVSWLTPRREQILDRVSAGKSNQEIATDLGIAVDTVKNTLKVIYEILGVWGSGARQEVTEWFLATHPGGPHE